MPIPQEILSVERPKNTVVIAYGKDKHLYAVRQRVGCKNVDGRHVPVNGPTIGHIVDGRYVVLECDLDLDAATVYKAYAGRWEIEVVMRYYKSACGFDETRVHDDYSVMGSEFCDFLSTLLTFRLLKSFDKCKLLDSMTYGKIMAQLKRAKKIRLDGSGWQLIRISPANQLMLHNLGLLPKPEQEEKRRPGRPKKSI